MQDWGFAPSEKELEAVQVAATAFRDKWASIKPPFPAVFDGTIADVHALDYMEYEGIGFPQGGIEAAAIVCGEVIRKAASLKWVISYRGDWFVASEGETYAAIAICPLARLHEIECGGAPQFGKYRWFLERAAFECLLAGDPAREPFIRKLLKADGEYVERVERTLLALRPLRNHHG